MCSLSPIESYHPSLILTIVADGGPFLEIGQIDPNKEIISSPSGSRAGSINLFFLSCRGNQDLILAQVQYPLLQGMLRNIRNMTLLLGYTRKRRESRNKEMPRYFWSHLCKIFFFFCSRPAPEGCVYVFLSTVKKKKACIPPLVSQLPQKTWQST